MWNLVRISLIYLSYNWVKKLTHSQCRSCNWQLRCGYTSNSAFMIILQVKCTYEVFFLISLINTQTGKFFCIHSSCVYLDFKDIVSRTFLLANSLKKNNNKTMRRRKICNLNINDFKKVDSSREVRTRDLRNESLARYH